VLYNTKGLAKFYLLVQLRCERFCTPGTKPPSTGEPRSAAAARRVLLLALYTFRMEKQQRCRFPSGVDGRWSMFEPRHVVRDCKLALFFNSARCFYALP